MLNTEEINGLNLALETMSPAQSLSLLVKRFGYGVVFSTSFSFEDQVITHLITQQQLPVSFFTIDTGRLFPETYSVWNRTLEFYGIHITAYFPDTPLLEKMIAEKGPNAFYHSIADRKLCCEIRKVEPLKRALYGKKLWITGLRREHSPERKTLQQVEWDSTNQVVKFHPLLNWTSDEVKRFVNQNGIPYNPLHDKGFVSIGCAPCTRAILPGEALRAGRWWWEDSSKKECGLHAR